MKSRSSYLHMRIPPVPGTPGMEPPTWTTPQKPISGGAVKASHGRKGLKSVVFKAGFSLIGNLMNTLLSWLRKNVYPAPAYWDSSIFLLWESWNCILITPNAFSVLLAISTSQSHLLSVASINLDTVVWKWYILIVSSIDVGGCSTCATPRGVCQLSRALYLGTLLWHGVPCQAPSAHHISPHLSLVRCTTHTLLLRGLSVTGPRQLNSFARFANPALFFHKYPVSPPKC